MPIKSYYLKKKKKLAIKHAWSTLWHEIKCVILENISTAIKIENGGGEWLLLLAPPSPPSLLQPPRTKINFTTLKLILLLYFLVNNIKTIKKSKSNFYFNLTFHFSIYETLPPSSNDTHLQSFVPNTLPWSIIHHTCPLHPPHRLVVLFVTLFNLNLVVLF